jgi:hypothetical protein
MRSAACCCVRRQVRRRGPAATPARGSQMCSARRRYAQRQATGVYGCYTCRRDGDGQVSVAVVRRQEARRRAAAAKSARGDDAAGRLKAARCGAQPHAALAEQAAPPRLGSLERKLSDGKGLRRAEQHASRSTHICAAATSWRKRGPGEALQRSERARARLSPHRGAGGVPCAPRARRESRVPPSGAAPHAEPEQRTASGTGPTYASGAAGNLTGDGSLLLSTTTSSQHQQPGLSPRRIVSCQAPLRVVVLPPSALFSFSAFTPPALPRAGAMLRPLRALIIGSPVRAACSSMTASTSV